MSGERRPLKARLFIHILALLLPRHRTPDFTSSLFRLTRYRTPVFLWWHLRLTRHRTKDFTSLLLRLHPINKGNCCLGQIFCKQLLLRIKLEPRPSPPTVWSLACAGWLICLAKWDTPIVSMYTFNRVL